MADVNSNQNFAAQQPASPVQPQGQPPFQGAPYPGQAPVSFQPAQPQIPVQQAYGYRAQFAPGYAAPMAESDRTLRLVAFILCLLSTIAMGIFIITLAWMIPMTVHCWGVYKGKKANTVAFGVCTLLFLNLISGILLLVSTKEA